MTADRSESASRYFDFRLAIGIPLGLMALLLLLDPSGVDFALAELFYEPGQGFIGRHSFWLEDILHDRAKQAVIFVGVMAIFGFALSLMPTRLSPFRRQLGYLVLALALSTSIVTPLKTLTGVHCPWSLSEFGEQKLLHLCSASARQPKSQGAVGQGGMPRQGSLCWLCFSHCATGVLAPLALL